MLFQDNNLLVVSNITLGGATIHTSPQTLTGAGAISLNQHITHLVTTGADALTLADGDEGQEKVIVMKTHGGDGTLTPSNFANGSTITLGASGQSTHLIFTNSAWHYIGGFGVTVA